MKIPKVTPGQFILSTAPDGAVKVDAFFQEETVWLAQKALADLFGVKRPAITKHLLSIFKTRELVEDSVSSILEHTAADGKKYGTKSGLLKAGRPNASWTAAGSARPP